MSPFPGYWGRGTTIDEAVKNAKYLRPKTKVLVMRCDANAKVTEMGWINYDAKEDVGVGTIGRNKATKELTVLNIAPVPRPISKIAAEIRKEWGRVYFGAVPYLKAMASLETINDRYGEDSARSVLAYFLSNATTWKGDVARRIKVEINTLLEL